MKVVAVSAFVFLVGKKNAGLLLENWMPHFQELQVPDSEDAVQMLMF